MKVGLNQVSFKSTGAGNQSRKGTVTLPENISVSTEENKTDSYLKSTDAAKTGKQPKTLKESVAGVWKFMSVANQMANAALKGLFYGALTGTAFLGGSWLFKSLPQSFSKEGPSLWQTIRHPLKHIGKAGKIIAGAASGIVLGYHLVAGKLHANQKTAVIDHKLKVGHRDK